MSHIYDIIFAISGSASVSSLTPNKKSFSRPKSTDPGSPLLRRALSPDRLHPRSAEAGGCHKKATTISPLCSPPCKAVTTSPLPSRATHSSPVSSHESSSSHSSSLNSSHRYFCCIFTLWTIWVIKTLQLHKGKRPVLIIN